jgi:lipopolysaccharide transport system permease protein
MKNPITYSSESEVRHPGKLVQRMVIDLIHAFPLAGSLMRRDISALYRQSLLGFAWAFIPSIVTALTFSFASRNKILNIGSTDIPYTAYVMFSVTLWQIFSEAVMGPVAGLTSSRSFITKINFAHEALFLSKMGEAIFNFFIKSILIAVIFLYYRIIPSPGIFLAVGLIFLLILLGQAIGLLLAPLSIVYQDFAKGLPLVLGLGMFITPVVYPMPVKESFVSKVIMHNPLTYVISGIRDLSIYGTTSYTQQIILITLCSVILFFLAWMVYSLSMPYVIERCG